MKTIKIFLITILSVFTFTSCHAQREFSEVSKLEGVQSVYIGKAMLKMAQGAGLSNAGSAGLDVSKLVDRLTSIEIINVEKRSSLAEANRLIDKYMAETAQEVLADIVEDEDHIVITGTLNEATDSFSRVLVRITEPGEAVVILMKGDIPMEILREAISKE